MYKRQHQDHASGARDNRPGLKSCLAELREGDVLIVWKLDRLGRSLSHLLRIIEDLKIRGIAFRSLTESIDTTTPHGSFLFNLFGTLAEYERTLITVSYTHLDVYKRHHLSQNALMLVWLLLSGGGEKAEGHRR